MTVHSKNGERKNDRILYNRKSRFAVKAVPRSGKYILHLEVGTYHILDRGFLSVIFSIINESMDHGGSEIMEEYKLSIYFTIQIGLCICYYPEVIEISIPFFKIYCGLRPDAEGFHFGSSI